MDKLQQKGLDLKTSGNSRATIEEVQHLLRSIGENETASDLKKLLDFGKHLTLFNYFRLFIGSLFRQWV